MDNNAFRSALEAYDREQPAEYWQEPVPDACIICGGALETRKEILQFEHDTCIEAEEMKILARARALDEPDRLPADNITEDDLPF